MATRFAKKSKLESKAAALTAEMPVGTPVMFWLGTDRVAMQTGVIVSRFGIENGNTVYAWIRSDPKRELVSAAASHIEKV